MHQNLQFLWNYQRHEWLTAILFRHVDYYLFDLIIEYVIFCNCFGSFEPETKLNPLNMSSVIHWKWSQFQIPLQDMFIQYNSITFHSIPYMYFNVDMIFLILLLILLVFEVWVMADRIHTLHEFKSAAMMLSLPYSLMIVVERLLS